MQRCLTIVISAIDISPRCQERPNLISRVVLTRTCSRRPMQRHLQLSPKSASRRRPWGLIQRTIEPVYCSWLLGSMVFSLLYLRDCGALGQYCSNHEHARLYTTSSAATCCRAPQRLAPAGPISPCQFNRSSATGAAGHPAKPVCTACSEVAAATNSQCHVLRRLPGSVHGLWIPSRFWLSLGSH